VDPVDPFRGRYTSVRAQGWEGDTWVDVRVLDGYAVLEELYVGGMPISDTAAGMASSDDRRGPDQLGRM